MKHSQKLGQLSDEQLISKTKLLAKQERELLTEVLHHLAEVDRRRLFSQLKFQSLFEYAVKELGYSDDQAFRRVTAARLLYQVPEIEIKIQSGTLTLANLSVVASAIRQKRKESKVTTQEIRKIVKLVEGQSKRGAESALINEQIVEAKDLRPEKIRQVGESVEIRMTVSQEMVEKIQQLKSLLAHSDPNIGTAELFEKLCDGELKNLATKKQCASPRRRRINAGMNTIYKMVWQNANGRCENCNGQHALEVDHRHPKAKGGSSDLSNLRLLCRSCNQRAAIEHFGQEHMNRYLNATYG